jgi:hypothetical protein
MDAKMNSNKLFNILIIIFFAMSAYGCFHDEEDDKSVDVSIINGTWFGVEEDVNAGNSNPDKLKNICFTILDGKITLVKREDQGIMKMVDQKIIGAVTAKTANIWSYTLNDTTDTSGGFYVDTSASHLSFLDDQFRFGVMEKVRNDDINIIKKECGDAATGDAVNMDRVYVDNDAAASWRGFSVNVLNGSMLARENFSSSVQVDMDTLAFVGVDSALSVTGGNFEGSLSLNDAMKGRYVGNWTNRDPLIIDTPPSGSMVSYVSADKTFLAARLCLPFINTVPDQELCTFAAWSK